MSWDLTTRCSAIVITIALASLLGSGRYWIGLVISFGLAHYLLSFYYAAGRVRGLVVSPTLALPLMSLGILLLVVYFLKFPLEIYFGIHHACNEGYLRRYHRQANGTADPQLPAFRTLFHLAAYLCILRHDAYVGQVPEAWLWLFLTLSGLLYARQLLIANQSLQGLSRLRDSSVEWLMLAVVGLSLLIKITFLQMVMYHFVLWTIVPIPVLRTAGTHKLVEYGLLSVASLGLFAALTISQLGSSLVPLSSVYSQFFFWSYVHITASFALSAAHPDWIVQLFRLPQAQSG
ncbi:MAG: hypothetical protein QNK19_16005 [Xanthomonadales bacterium]|nr:hypothetical protein [Xanthomonadales bacterium]